MFNSFVFNLGGGLGKDRQGLANISSLIMSSNISKRGIGCDKSKKSKKRRKTTEIIIDKNKIDNSFYFMRDGCKLAKRYPDRYKSQ